MQKHTNVHADNIDMDEIEYVVCHVAMLWRRLIAQCVKKLGISITEKRALFCIMRNPGLTQVQLAKMLDLEPQNLLRTLDKLEKSEWISKTADPEDRRVKCLSITSGAKKIIAEINKVSAAAKKQVLADADPKKTALAAKYLAGLRKNLLGLMEEE